MKAARVRRPKPAWLVAAIATGALLSGCQNQSPPPAPTPTPTTGPVTVGSSTVDVTAGASGAVALKVASSSPLTGTLTLHLTVKDPSGAAASGFTISPTTVQAGGKSSLDLQVMVAAAAGSAAGTYKATVTVSNAAFHGSASFDIVVASAPHQGTCTLDPSFGSNGRVATNLGTALAGIDSLGVQASGKLVVGLASGLGAYLLARLNVDGSLDTSFGHAGFVNTHFFDNSPLFPFSTARILGSGDILVAGVGAITAGNASKSTLRLAEYGPDGAPVTSFGSGGVVDTGIPAYEAHAIRSLPDGTALVLASGFPGGGVLLRVLPDGTLDTTFGNAGVVQLDQLGYPSALAVQSSGRILVGDPVSGSPTVHGYTAGGAVDTSFGNGGTVTLSAPNAFTIRLAVLADDSVIVAASDGTAAQATLFGLGADGTPDTAFGSNGSAAVPSTAEALVQDASGRIYVAGHAWTSSPASAATVSRFTAGGTLDASFGSGGTSAFSAFPGGLNRVKAIALNAQGDVVLAGIAAASTAGSDYGPGARQGMVAETDGSGAPVSAFGTSGLAAVQPPADDFPGFVLVKPGGGIVVGGVTYRQYGQGLLASFASYDASGSLDPAYGTGGVSTTVTTAIDLALSANAQDPQGRIVASTATGMLRALPDGGLDPTFGSGGMLTTDFWPGPYQNGPGTLAPLPDSSLIVGETPYFGVTNSFVLAHLDASGALDASFGSGGFATFQVGSSNTMLHGLLVRSNGKILAVGETVQAGLDKWVVAQFDPNGSLDTSFGTNGATVIGGSDPTFNSSVHALDVTATGKLLVLGLGKTGSGRVGFVAARVDADGTLDGSFGTQGIARVGVGSKFTGSGQNEYAARVESDGSIAMAAEVDATLYLARLTASGTPDDGFSAGGYMPAPMTPGNGRTQFLGGTGTTSLAIEPDGSLLAARAVDGPVDKDFGVWRCVPH